MAADSRVLLNQLADAPLLPQNQPWSAAVLPQRAEAPGSRSVLPFPGHQASHARKHCSWRTRRAANGLQPLLSTSAERPCLQPMEFQRCLVKSSLHSPSPCLLSHTALQQGALSPARRSKASMGARPLGCPAGSLVPPSASYTARTPGPGVFLFFLSGHGFPRHHSFDSSGGVRPQASMSQ
ncbi:hypothetical protein Zm00014a_029048 [Zea mays]|uniref:Uncharacterized protein n=2 Tax=Zea mays TaxID=4577 RepID=A0A8J8YIG6_MAIZE|nr:hypothetical protein Zm00014a_029048 [Zea mays]